MAKAPLNPEPKRGFGRPDNVEERLEHLHTMVHELAEAQKTALEHLHTMVHELAEAQKTALDKQREQLHSLTKLHNATAVQVKAANSKLATLLTSVVELRTLIVNGPAQPELVIAVDALMKNLQAVDDLVPDEEP